MCLSQVSGPQPSLLIWINARAHSWAGQRQHRAVPGQSCSSSVLECQAHFSDCPILPILQGLVPPHHIPC